MRTIAILPLLGACGHDQFVLATKSNEAPATPGPIQTTPPEDPSDPTDPDPVTDPEVDGVWLGSCGFYFSGSDYLDAYRFRLDLAESGGAVSGDGQMELHVDAGTGYSYTSPAMQVGADGDFDGATLTVDILVGPQEVVFATIDGVVSGDTWAGEMFGDYSSSSSTYGTYYTTCELVRQ